MRKPFFAYGKTKPQTSFALTAKLISTFVLATQRLQSLYFLNPKFQAYSHLLELYSLVCVGAGRKSLRPVFSQRDSYDYTNSCDLSTAKRGTIMSQAQSQSAKAAANMDRGEKERKVNELVKFLLVMDQKKLPIKKQGTCI